MSQTIQTNTRVLLQNEEDIAFFTENLVRAVLGCSILDIEESEQESAISSCIQLFTDYIVNYIKDKYGNKEALRLKAAQKFINQDVFLKFNGLGDKFNEAYLSFFESLETQNTTQEA